MLRHRPVVSVVVVLNVVCIPFVTLISASSLFGAIPRGASGNARSASNVSEEVMGFLDTSADPCLNFYQFACGGFINRNKNGAGYVSSLNAPYQRVVDAVQPVLQQKIRGSKFTALNKAKLLYQSCMDTARIDKRGLTPLRRFFENRGGLPVLGQWNEQGFDLVGALGESRALLKDNEFPFSPSGILVGMTIQKDFRQFDRYAIYFDQPQLGQLDFDLSTNEIYLLGKNTLYTRAYTKYLIDAAILLGANREVARRDMTDFVRLEIELTRAMLPESERRRYERRYNKMSLLELSLRYPHFDWLRYIRTAFRSAGVSVHVSYSKSVILWVPEYYDQLFKILQRTPTRTIANYILFSSVQSLLPALNREVRDLFNRYVRTINGVKSPQEQPQRSQFCTNIVVREMDWVASRIFIETAGTPEDILAAKELGGYVRKAYTNMIKQANWLDSRTKREAIAKMNSVKDKIGFPKAITSNLYLDKYYNEFIFSSNFFENIEITYRQNYAIVARKLVLPPADDQVLRPTSVNAAHNYGTNSIEIPAAFIAPPLFSLDYPMSMNFGALGYFFGHEYQHGFDVTGFDFDKNGELNRYYSDYSVQNLQIKANCFVKQFSKYYIPEANLLITNGDKTLNENLCDTAGVQAGFNGYQQWKRARGYGSLDVIPSLPFSGEQLFFINTARSWCSAATPQFLRRFPYIDFHSIDRIRVIGTLQNIPEFSKAFRCPVGSHMNPKIKCTFW